MIVVTFFTEMLVMPPIPLDRTDEAAPGGCLPVIIRESTPWILPTYL